MEPEPRRSMRVRIVLPEDINPTDNITSKPLVRHCGDEILGHLEVTTCGKFELELDVSFEGIVRTWVGSDHGRDPYALPPTAEFCFLEETQRVFPDPVHRSCNSDVCILRIPFRFIVPWELVPARSDVHQGFLSLCPSTKQGCNFLGPFKKLYHQPMITYLIRVKRIKTDLPVATVDSPRSHREIIVMPYTPPAPPLALELLQCEYRCSFGKPLRQHRWAKALGLLSISAAEPSPLNISTVSPRPSTCVDLHVIFTSNSLGHLDEPLSGWNVVVKQHLRSRTFYSTRWLQQLPTLVASKSSPYLKMRETKRCPEVREYQQIVWEKQNKSSNTDAVCSWTALLKVPICTRNSLLPTFANPLSARQYAVVLQFSIKGLYSSAMELILPVQVIYYPVHLPRMELYDAVARELWDAQSFTAQGLRRDSLASEDDEPGQRQPHESPYDETPPPYDL